MSTSVRNCDVPETWDRSGLPAWTYYDEDLAEIEKDLLFRRHWQLACQRFNIFPEVSLLDLPLPCDPIMREALCMPLHALKRCDKGLYPVLTPGINPSYCNTAFIKGSLCGSDHGIDSYPVCLLCIDCRYCKRKGSLRT